MVARTDARGKALNATAETIHLQDTIIITIVASGLVAGIREGLSRQMDKGGGRYGELLEYAHAM